MIKTLRITSVLAAIAAAVLIKYFVFPMVVGAGGDDRVDKVLDAPTVVEKFRETTDAGTKSTGGPRSPLVEQALAFAGHLAPKTKVPPPGTRGRGSTTRPPTLATTPKFKVFATTYFEGNPSLSQALIDEPGRGRRWVRQSSMVGHLLIEQVKDGVVVVKSSKDTYELPVETNSEAAPVKKTSPVSRVSRPTTGRSITGRSSPTSNRAASGISRTPSKPAIQQRGPVSSENSALLIESLKDLQKKTQAPQDKARIGELMSIWQARQGGAEGAQNPTKPGEKITSEGADPNRTASPVKGGKIDTGSAKPAPLSSK
ncbi:MAG: hypothetical protein ACYSWQ_03905 [Planctomycetota bacterium]|jgi:hypothetical protein